MRCKKSWSAPRRLGDESVQKIPMAISVISPATLDAKGLSGISDFVGELPSVNMQSVSPGENVIDMRGLVTSEVDPTNAQERSLVALYLDDSSIGMEGFNPDLHVYDLERVEVIRGPQGTLYGAGSMAGTIRLITKKPDPNGSSWAMPICRCPRPSTAAPTPVFAAWSIFR